VDEPLEVRSVGAARVLDRLEVREDGRVGRLLEQGGLDALELVVALLHRPCTRDGACHCPEPPLSARGPKPEARAEQVIRYAPKRTRISTR